MYRTNKWPMFFEISSQPQSAADLPVSLATRNRLLRNTTPGTLNENILPRLPICRRHQFWMSRVSPSQKLKHRSFLIDPTLVLPNRRYFKTVRDKTREFVWKQTHGGTRTILIFPHELYKPKSFWEPLRGKHWSLQSWIDAVPSDIEDLQITPTRGKDLPFNRSKTVRHCHKESRLL